MAWTRIDGMFLQNPKVQKVGVYGMALYLAGLIYCNSNLTDGFITNSMLPMLCGMAYQTPARRTADRLVNENLWELVDGGYQVHDFLTFNKSKQDIEQLNKQRANNGAKGGRSAKHNQSDLLTNLLSKPVSNKQSKPVSKQPPIIPNTLLPKKEDPPTPHFGGLATTGFPDMGKVFMAVTGMPGIPGGELPKILPALDALWDSRKYSNGDALVSYLKPYYEAWISRRGKNGAFYSRSNCTWLYDWAITGSIPTEFEAERPKMRKLRDAAGNVVEVPV